MGKLNQESGLENVAYLGGFIEDCLINKLEEKYPPAVVKRVMQKAKVDSSIWRLCEELAIVYRTITEYPSHVYADRGMFFGVAEMSPFADWLLDQDIRCMQLKMASNKKPFWCHMDLNSFEEQCASSLIAVEERVMAYKLGFETGREMEAEEIAQLPEFDCDVTWIDRVISGVKDTFEHEEDETDSFYRFCSKLLRKEDKING